MQFNLIYIVHDQISIDVDYKIEEKLGQLEEKKKN